MRTVIQRVSSSSVVIDGVCHGEIGPGLNILIGIENGDADEDIEWLCHKIVNLRIFDDDSGVMNLSVRDVDGDILVISQFTLYASTRKGNRPSYIKAARPEISIPLYEKFLQRLENILGKPVKKGIFGANMRVTIVNEGPVTILIDTKNRE
mgnify:FL=1